MIVVEGGRDQHSNFAGKGGTRERDQISAARLRPCLRPYAAAAAEGGHNNTHNALFWRGRGGRDVLISFLGDGGRSGHRPQGVQVRGQIRTTSSYEAFYTGLTDL